MHRIWDRARGNLKNHAMGKKSVGISFFSGYAHFAKWVEKIFSNIPPYRSHWTHRWYENDCRNAKFTSAIPKPVLFHRLYPWKLCTNINKKFMNRITQAFQSSSRYVSMVFCYTFPFFETLSFRGETQTTS